MRRRRSVPHSSSSGIKWFPFSRDVQSDVAIADEISVVRVVDVNADDPEDRCVDWLAFACRSVPQQTDDFRCVRSEIENILCSHNLRLHSEEYPQSCTYVWHVSNVHGDSEVFAEGVNETVATRAAGEPSLEGSSIDDDQRTLLVDFQTFEQRRRSCT